jgi:hypothetical protein
MTTKPTASFDRFDHRLVDRRLGRLSDGDSDRVSRVVGLVLGF